MAMMMFGTEERLVRDLLDSLATEQCWACHANSTNAGPSTQQLELLADATGFDRSVIQNWYIEAQEKAGKRVKLDIQLSITKLQSDKTKSDLVSKWGVFCLVQIVNSENNSAACEKAQQTVGMVRSRSNSVSSLNQAFGPEHSILNGRRTRIRNDSERYRSNASDDDLLSPSPPRKMSTENLSSPTLWIDQPASRQHFKPLNTTDFADSESSLLDDQPRKRSLTQADQSMVTFQKQSDSSSHQSYRSAEEHGEDSDGSDGFVDNENDSVGEDVIDNSVDLLSQVTGTVKADGIFQRPNLEFKGVVCNRTTAVIVSAWFRFLGQDSDVSSEERRASVDDKVRKNFAAEVNIKPEYPSIKRKRGPFAFRWFRNQTGSGKLPLHVDNKACLGWATIPLQSQVNASVGGWIPLPKPNCASESSPKPNKPQKASFLHWNKKPLQDCQHSKEFQVEMQLQTKFHQVEYNERTAAFFKEGVKTYFEAARLFYRHALLQTERFTGELSEEAQQILTIFAQKKCLSERAIKILNLAAVMTLRESANLFLDTDLYANYISNAVRLHHLLLVAVLPKNGLHERPKYNSHERNGSFSLASNTSALSLSLGNEITTSVIDPTVKIALPTLVLYASGFVNESVRVLEDEAPATFPLTEEAMDYLQRRIDLIWEVMNAPYLPEDVREMLNSGVRKQFAQRFFNDASSWFQRRLDMATKTNERAVGQSLMNPLTRQSSISIVRDNEFKKPAVDTLDQLRSKITLLIDTLREATKNCTPRLHVLNHFRSYHINYFANVAAGIDSVATEQITVLLPRFIAYQRRHQMFQSNLTITSGLSFKLYRAIVEFARLTKESITCTDNDGEITPTTFTRLVEEATVSSMTSGQSLCQYEQMFQPCVVYWMHAFRDMSITRIRDAVATDTTMASLYEKPISVSAYDTVTCISEMVTECRCIEFSDPRQSMLINVRSVDIACELITIYANAIIKQAYAIKNETIKANITEAPGSLFPVQMESPKPRRRKSSASELEIREAKEVGERLMRALSNIQHVSEETWKKLENIDAGFDMDEQSIVTTMTSTHASRDTGISLEAGDHDPAVVPSREERLTKDLIDNCRQTLTSIVNKCIDAHARVTAAKAEPLVQAFLDEAAIPQADHLMSVINDMLVSISKNLEGELAVHCVRKSWSVICQMISRNLAVCGKYPSYYSKVLKYVRDLEQVFSSTETERIVIFPKVLQEEESYKTLVTELNARSQNCKALIKTYLRNIANCDESRLSPTKQKRQCVRHFQNEVENPPLLEGEIYIQLGKISSDGVMVLAIHGMTLAVCEETNYYYNVSLKPDFEFTQAQMNTDKQNRHDGREFKTFEFTGIRQDQFNDDSNVLVIEIWRNRLACDSFLGELVIAFADIPEGISRTNIFDRTETKTVNFYQPRTLNHLLDIMHTREQFSSAINHFLQWRLSILLRVDLKCVVRANQLRLQREESTSMTSRSMTSRQSSSTSRQSTTTNASGTSLGSISERVMQWLPDTQAVVLTMKAHRALVSLNIASHRNDMIPTCFVRYLAKPELELE